MNSFAVLTFRLGNQRYGLRIEDVIEVMAMVAVERLAGARPELLGVVNRHGSPMPLLDLRLILGGMTAPVAASTLFVVVGSETQTAGLVVDEVYQVEYFRSLTPAPQGTPLISALATDRDQMTQVMILDEILARYLPDDNGFQRG